MKKYKEGKDKTLDLIFVHKNIKMKNGTIDGHTFLALDEGVKFVGFAIKDSEIAMTLSKHFKSMHKYLKKKEKKREKENDSNQEAD